MGKLCYGCRMVNLIDRLGRIAVIVQRGRWLWIALALAAAVLIAASVVENPWLVDDRWLMPGIVALCWPLTLLSFGRLFDSVPPAATAKMSWRGRLSRRLHRGVLWLLGLAMIGLTLAVLLLSWQLLRVWIMS